MTATSTREWFTTTIEVGTERYYDAAIVAGYYGVEDDGRCFRAARDQRQEENS